MGTILQMGFNLFFLSASILLMFVALVMWRTKMSPVRRLVLLSLFIGSCSLWFFIRSPLFGLEMVNRPLMETLDVFCQYAITLFSLSYVLEFVDGWRKKVLGICRSWTVVFIVVTSLLHFGMVLRYSDLLVVGVISNVIFILLMGVCTGWEAFGEKNDDARRLVFSAIPALLGGLLEIGVYLGGDTASTGTWFFTGLLLFFLMRIFWFILYLQRQAEQRAKLEQELLDARISIMLSQIQPHFLYNTLQGIKHLCDTNPPIASEALEHFAFYLRGNLDSLEEMPMISFEQELVHIRDYLYLEKMRFPKKLRVEWALTVEDFRIPPLAVQPLIENAIRHGINRKSGGGTVTIGTNETEESYVVFVQDDGVGFEPDEPYVGIENTRKQLAHLCGGSLVIESQKGVGTTAKIIIPKEGKLCI